MRKAFLKKARENLASMRAQMLKNVQQELQEGRDQNKDEGMDTYDLASDARDREINHILTDRDRGKLEAIDDGQGRVVELRFTLGLTVEETARATGLPERTVKRRWQAARAWLLDYLAPPGS